MKEHVSFIIGAYLITFMGCSVLILATLMRMRTLRKKLKLLSDDQTG